MLKKYLNDSNYEISISLSKKFIDYDEKETMDVNVEVVDIIKGGDVFHSNYATSYATIRDFKIREGLQGVKNLTIYREWGLKALFLLLFLVGKNRLTIMLLFYYFFKIFFAFFYPIFKVGNIRLITFNILCFLAASFGCFFWFLIFHKVK